MIKKIIMNFMFLFIGMNLSFSQDTLFFYSSRVQETIDTNRYQFVNNQLLIPGILISAGTICYTIPSLRNLDFSIRHQVYRFSPHRTSLDDYAQYFPAAMVYALGLYGEEGVHGFGDRTIIYATSQAITAIMVTPAKSFIGRERPDGSNNRSFPSGHTATAFSTAHFMFKEYHGRNLFLRCAGYPFAFFTGAYRVLNNKHWVTDVIVGAGVGILSTEASYWLFPYINTVFRNGDKKVIGVFLPSLGQGNLGFSYFLVF